MNATWRLCWGWRGPQQPLEPQLRGAVPKFLEGTQSYLPGPEHRIGTGKKTLRMTALHPVPASVQMAVQTRAALATARGCPIESHSNSVPRFSRQLAPAGPEPLDDCHVAKLLESPSADSMGNGSARDLEVAVNIVELACWLTERVQAQLRLAEETANTKADKSFVTLADYGVQAVASWLLAQAYPGEDVSLVAEEDANDLTGESNAEALQCLVAVVNECLAQALRVGFRPPAKPLTAMEILASISRGGSPGGPHGRHWVLDPVDGTLGFVRQDQYALALALLEDGQLRLGVLGCPNYPGKNGGAPPDPPGVQWSSPGVPTATERPCPPAWGWKAWTAAGTGCQAGARGILVAAQRGEGAFAKPLCQGRMDDVGSALENKAWSRRTDPSSGTVVDVEGAMGMESRLVVPSVFQPPNRQEWTRIRTSIVQDSTLARFCEPVEGANSDQHVSQQVARLLGISNDPLRLYSMAKYAAVAQGDAEIFMKFPGETYKEKIWDHAAGVIVIEEAGGMVTDAMGAPLDFSRGRFLEGMKGGIVASCSPDMHAKVLHALQAVRHKSGHGLPPELEQYRGSMGEGSARPLVRSAL